MMVRPGFTGNRTRADPVIGPPPRRDAFPDEYSFLLANIVWERGGLDRFGAVAREAAAAMAALMVEMRICPPNELAKNIEALAKMEVKLPPAVNVERTATILGPDATTQDLANAYARMLVDPAEEFEFEPGYDA
jgi:hypothetical protein